MTAALPARIPIRFFPTLGHVHHPEEACTYVIDGFLTMVALCTTVKEFLE